MYPSMIREKEYFLSEDEDELKIEMLSKNNKNYDKNYQRCTQGVRGGWWLVGGKALIHSGNM